MKISDNPPIIRTRHDNNNISDPIKPLLLYIIIDSDTFTDPIKI